MAQNNSINNETDTLTISSLGQGILVTDANGVVSTNTYTIGTWTPDLTFGGSNTGITYVSRAGDYFRIGRFVFAAFVIVLSSKGTATGNAAIGGFPVAPSSTVAIRNIITTSRVTYTGSFLGIGMQIGLTSALIWEFSSGGVETQITDTAFAGNDVLRGMICYLSA